MKFVRPDAGYTLRNDIHNESIIKQLGVANIAQDIEKYKRQWKAYTDMMEDKRLPKRAIQYRPLVRRNVGRFKECCQMSNET
jgi:hypothetical protein